MKLQNAYDVTDYRAVLERGDILFFPNGAFKEQAQNGVRCETVPHPIGGAPRTLCASDGPSKFTQPGAAERVPPPISGTAHGGSCAFEIPSTVRTALMGATQDARSFHKNIAYKPNRDQVSGLVDRAEAETVRPAMREYSRCALGFLKSILPEYARAWKVDYASFRSIEEKGRELPLTKRNDLLHVDAFPTRPVFGDLILRCFTNVNPEQSREWMTSDPFERLASEQAMRAGLARFADAAGSSFTELRRSLTRGAAGLGIPVVDRSAYDAFMLHFHDWLKGNREYQEGCAKYRFLLPPGSTWLVFTDVVPHAVLSGRLALEQTVIVSRESLANGDRAPSSILEKMTGRALTR